MHTAEIEIDNEVCYISVTQFGDTNFVTISDTGTFGSFYQVEKKEKMGNEPIFNIQPIFGQAEDYLQVSPFSSGPEVRMLKSWEMDRNLNF